jgi:hypothetical protein
LAFVRDAIVAAARAVGSDEHTIDAGINRDRADIR